MPVMLTLMAQHDPAGKFLLMLIRMASNTPPPLWQVWTSIVLGLGGAYAAVWGSAKIFRIGLLLHGKPPDFRTMLRWIRMA